MESSACSNDPTSRYGLTEVHHPATGIALVDVVFVHGLDGHPYSTWTNERDRVFWPAQLLPPILQEEQARVLVYGYDADVALSLDRTSQSSKDRIRHHAEGLLAELWANRRKQAQERPIIFIAHSLGGLVVKRALIYSSEVWGNKTRHYRSIYVSTYGVLFFGTPHQGFDVTTWVSRRKRTYEAMLSDDLTKNRPQILDALKLNNETLQIIDRDFMQLTGKLHIYFFYEGKPTNVNGSLHYIVEEESAAPVIQDVERASIQQDHAHMCQFENNQSPGFNLVTEAIQRYAAAAPKKIKADWQLEQAKRGATKEAQVKELGGRIDREDQQASNTPQKATDSNCKRHYIVPRERVKDFIGRKAQLDQISSYFPNTLRNNRPQKLVLHALGGQGKSQIALEYCQSSRDQYRGIFWVNASSEALAMSSYSRIAAALDGASSAYVKDGDQTISRVKDILEEWNGTWLLIFDNYDQPKDFLNVQKFIPKFGHGLVIFTSRNRDLVELGHLIEIPAMSAEEGVNLLLRDHNGEDIKQHFAIASKIVDRLGGLPLAVDQARAYIRYQRMPLHQLGDFIATYDLKRKQILSYTPAHFWNYGTMQIHGKEEQNKATNAFTTWEMSLEELRIDDGLPRDEMKDFLTLSAFFNTTRIEEFLFRNYLKACKNYIGIDKLAGETGNNIIKIYGERGDQDLSSQSSDGFWDVLSKFHELSLLQNLERNTGEAVFSLHPLIRDWLQLREETDGRRKSAAASLDIVAASARVHNNQRLSPGQCTALLAHANVCLFNHEYSYAKQRQFGHDMEDCDIAYDLACFYLDQGHYERSERLVRRATTTRSREFGPDHETTLNSQTVLGYVLLKQGKYDEAESIHRQVLQLRKKLLGKNDEETVNSLHELAVVLYRKGRNEEAEGMVRQVLQWRKMTLGEEHVNTLNSMGDLASVLCDQGKFEEAEKINRETLHKHGTLRGKKHPDTLTSINKLAAMLSRQGKWEEARLEFCETLRLREEVLGKKHPKTLLSMHNLAVTLRKQDKSEEARLKFVETLQVRGKVLGKKHPDTLNTMHSLAMLLPDHEAEPMLRRTMAFREEVLGEKHPNTLITMHNLATILPDHEAEQMLRRTMALRVEVLGEKHSDTLNTMYELAMVLSNHEAEPMFRQTLALEEEILGTKHPDTLLTMYWLAKLLSDHEAEELLRRTMALREEVLGTEHWETLLTMEDLADVLRRQGKCGEAEEIEQQRLQREKPAD